jgi:acyl-CoA dehydrogenase
VNDVGGHAPRVDGDAATMLLVRACIQWKFAHAAMDSHAAQLMTYHCATRWDAGQDVRMKASMAKLAASEMVLRVVDMAMQVHGGMGCAKDLPLERIYRKVRLQRIVEGASKSTLRSSTSCSSKDGGR